MPPKVKFSKDEIILAAVSITREKGIGAVTAREVGAALGVSSRPLFTYFDTVEELKREVYLFAEDLYRKYVLDGLKLPIPALGVGQMYLRFAREETELYKYLFLSPPDGVKGSAMAVLRLSQELVRESIMRIYHMDADTADKYFRDLWLVAYSFTTLIVTGECPYTDDEISAILTEFSLSICKAYKEIPGLPDGNFDKDAIFTELVQK
ncbi:MAG: TetR/AcrR family transcriptional regulator [Ruminococcus sp.]|nr:TetR/AcrR family transcriptional regulator [Ruminococcus sp.]